MKDHKFIPIEGTDPKSYIVECLKTGGSFSTNGWRKGYFKKNQCPCCGEVLR